MKQKSVSGYFLNENFVLKKAYLASLAVVAPLL